MAKLNLYISAAAYSVLTMFLDTLLGDIKEWMQAIKTTECLLPILTIWVQVLGYTCWKEGRHYCLFVHISMHLRVLMCTHKCKLNIVFFLKNEREILLWFIIAKRRHVYRNCSVLYYLQMWDPNQLYRLYNELVEWENYLERRLSLNLVLKYDEF